MGKIFRMNRKAVSPVIATIILVAIAIAIAIAVAYWMVGITGAFTRFEKLEITSAYSDPLTSGTFTVNLKLKNTGSAAATIDNVFINGKPWDAYVDVAYSFVSSSLEPGDATTGTITLPSASGFSSGMSVEIVLHTASGKDYPKQVVLP